MQNEIAFCKHSGNKISKLQAEAGIPVGFRGTVCLKEKLNYNSEVGMKHKPRLKMYKQRHEEILADDGALRGAEKKQEKD